MIAQHKFYCFELFVLKTASIPDTRRFTTISIRGVSRRAACARRYSRAETIISRFSYVNIEFNRNDPITYSSHPKSPSSITMNDIPSAQRSCIICPTPGMTNSESNKLFNLFPIANYFWLFKFLLSFFPQFVQFFKW